MGGNVKTNLDTRSLSAYIYCIASVVDKEVNMSAHTDKVIEHFLDAIGQVHGRGYKDNMSVIFCGGHYFKVKYPHQDQGTIVPVGHLDLMTKDLLENPEQHREQHKTHFANA